METVSRNPFVLVTGGSGGIGSALCKLCPSFGFTPIIAFNTSATKAHMLAQETKGFAVHMDMNVEDSILTAVDLIGKKIEPSRHLAAVVVGASPPPSLEPLLKISSDQLTSQLQVNLIGPTFLLQHLVKKFFKRDKVGTVVGILSEAIGSHNKPPSTGMGSYVLAKTALEGLLSLCAAEYPWLKVRTVSPGFTRTPMLDVFDPRYLELAHANKPILTPEEVAAQIMEQLLS